MKFINIQTERFKCYERLSDSEKVCLLDSIVSYAREDGSSDEDKPPIVDVIFAPIQADMDYYNDSYQAKVERARNNGKAGGRPKSNQVVTEKEQIGSFRNREKAKKHKEENKEDNKEDNKEERYSDDEAMNTAITRWLAYKKERKQSYTPIGEKAFITKLGNLSGGNGEIAIKIVEESMSNNYSGIFPLKESSVNSEVGQVLSGSTSKDYNKGGW